MFASWIFFITSPTMNPLWLPKRSLGIHPTSTASSDQRFLLTTGGPLTPYIYSISHIYMYITQTQSRTNTYFCMHLLSWPVHNIVFWLLILGMPSYLWLPVNADNGQLIWYLTSSNFRYWPRMQVPKSYIPAMQQRLMYFLHVRSSLTVIPRYLLLSTASNLRLCK